MSSVAASSDSAFELPGRYSLRPMRESDLRELHAVVERNRDELARWLSWAQQPSLESTRAHLDRDNDGGAIGYWLDVEHRGRGVMSAAVGALVNYGFDALALRRIEIRTDVLNRASRAIAERLGFQLDGVLRQSYRVSDGHYSDDAVYSMLATDPAGQALAEGASVA